MEGFDFWGYTIAEDVLLPIFSFVPLLRKILVSYIQILSNKQ